MAVCSEDQINLTALQRMDSKIVEIVGNASQVVVYKFNVHQNEWVDMDIEGSLFIYRRSEIPYHGFVIMNRMNTTNLVESFVRGLEFKKQEPCLMYQNQSCSIYCTWFYDLQDYLSVSMLIQRIIYSKRGKARIERKRSSSESTSVIEQTTGSTEVKDVISILTQAQLEYDKKNGEILESSDDQLTPGINGYRSPLSRKLKLVTSANGENIYKVLSTQSRRRFLSGNEVSSTIIDEEAIVGQPTFLVGHEAQRHSEDSSHCITNGMLDHSPVSYDVQGNDMNLNNPALSILKISDFQLETNDRIANHDSTTPPPSCFPSILKREYLHKHTPSNHNGELTADVFPKNILLSSFQFMKNIANSNPSQKVDVPSKCKKKLYSGDNGLLTNLKYHDNCTEQVKQSLFHLLQLEANLVGKIHNAHRSIQISNNKSRLCLGASPEIHI